MARRWQIAAWAMLSLWPAASPGEPVEPVDKGVAVKGAAVKAPGVTAAELAKAKVKATAVSAGGSRGAAGQAVAGETGVGVAAKAATTYVKPANKPEAGPPRWRLQDLTTPEGRSAFDKSVIEFCHGTFTLSEPKEANDAPAGTRLRQDPSPQAWVTCSSEITVVRSSGPPPDPGKTEPDRTPSDGTKTSAPSANSEPNKDRGDAVPGVAATAAATYVNPVIDPEVGPPTWSLQDLKTPEGRLAFDKSVIEFCRGTLRLGGQKEANDAPAETMLRQVPLPGVRVNCGSAITVVRSSGPSEPHWPMPDLTQPSGVDGLLSEFAEACKAQAVITFRDFKSSAPKGQIIGQTPPVGETIGCGTSFSAERSAGSAPDGLPWWLIPLGVLGLGGVAYLLRPRPDNNPFPTGEPQIVPGKLGVSAEIVGPLTLAEPEISVDVRPGMARAAVLTPFVIVSEDLRDG